MSTKSESVGVDSLLWVSSVATNCFIVLMSMESLVDSILGAGARGSGHGSCGAMKEKAHGVMDLF